MNGRLDQVGFWIGKTLSTAEITKLYNSGNGLSYSQMTGTTIAPDAGGNSGYQTAQSSYSFSYSCGADPSRFLVLGVSMLSVAGSSVASITYNGVAATNIGSVASVSGAVRSELWGLVAPATGSNTVAVTLSAGLDSITGATCYSGVNQTSPYEAYTSTTATNVGASDATVDVLTVADNDWVVDTVASDDTAITVGDGASIGTDTATVDFTGTTEDWFIGSNPTPAEFWNGSLDEIHLVGADLGANWITTEFNNQNSPSTFMTLSEQMVATGNLFMPAVLGR